MTDEIHRLLGDFLDKIDRLRLSPLQVASGGWKYIPDVDSRGEGWGGATWESEERSKEDWRTPLSLKSNTILGWDQTKELVRAINEATDADLSYIRGELSDLAGSYLRNRDSPDQKKLVDILAEEFSDLFSVGLPAKFLAILSGIEVTANLSPASPVPRVRRERPPNRVFGDQVLYVLSERLLVPEVDGVQSADPGFVRFREDHSRGPWQTPRKLPGECALR
ncbi:MAG: hypothetical protein V3U30_03710 [Thermoplasmata archaeon]